MAITLEEIKKSYQEKAAGASTGNLQEIKNLYKQKKEEASAASSRSESMRTSLGRRPLGADQPVETVSAKPVAEKPSLQQNQISSEIAARTAGAGSKDPIGTAAHMTKISGLQVQEAELKLNQSKAKLDAARQKEMALTEQSKKLASAHQGLRQLMTQYEMSGDEVTGQAYLLAAEEYNKLLEQYQKDYAAYEKDASVYDEYNSNLLKYQKAYAGYEKNMQTYNTERAEYLQEHPEVVLQDASDREIQRALDRLEGEKSGLILTGKAVDWEAVEDVNRKIDAVKQLQQQKRMSADNGLWNSGAEAFIDRSLAAIQAGQMDWFAGVAAVEQKVSNAVLKIVGSQIAGIGMSTGNSAIEEYGMQLIKNSNKKSEDAAEALAASREYLNEAVIGAGKIDGWIIEKMQSVGSMMMDMMAAGSTYAMGIPAGADAGKIMAIRAGGSGMLQAQKEGKSETEQLLMGIATGALEYASERMFGGNPIYDAESGWVTKGLEKVIKNPKIMKLFYSDGFGILSEGIEEWFTAFVEPIAEGFFTWEKPEMATAAELADAFAGGVFLSLAGQGSSVVVREVSGAGRAERQAGRVIQRSDAVQELVSEGLAAKPNTEAFKLATELQAKLDAGKKLSAAEIGRQLFANQDAIDAGLLVDDEMQPDSEAPEGALQDPDNGYYAIQTAEADGKQTYQLVEVREDGSIRKIGQPVDDLMAAKRAAQAQGLNVRHIGKEDVLRDAAQTTMDQVNVADTESTVAEKPTDMKKTTPANAVDVGYTEVNEGLQWAGNQNEGGTENVRTEQADGAGIDRSAGRDAVLDAEGSGAGQSAEWTAELERRRTARSEIESVVEDLRKRGRLSTTSSAALGVMGGSENDRVGVIRQSDETEQLRQIRNRNAEMGLDTVFVTDRLSVNIGTGAMTVSGVHEKGRVVLQVNAADYTVDELADHELYHERARRDPELVRRTREALQTNHSEEELDALFRHYMNIYSRAYRDREGMTQEALEAKVYEEMLADASARHRTSNEIDASVLSEHVREQTTGQTETMVQTAIEEQAKRDAAAETINEEAIKPPSDIGSIQQDPEFRQLQKDLQEGVIDRREYEKELAEYIDRLSDQKSSEEYEDEKDQRFALEGYEEELPQILDAGIRQAATMEPVRDMTGEEFKKGEKDLTEQVTEFFEEAGNKAVHPILGEVTLNRRGVKDDIAHGIGRNKAITFTAVPDVIEKGGLIDYQENWKERGYDTAVVAAPVSIAEKPYMMGVVLMRENGGNRFYVHEALAESEEGAPPFKTGTAKSGASGGDAPSVISLLQRVLDVKKSEQSFAVSSETDESAEAAEDAATGDELTNEIRHTAGGVESYVLSMPSKAKKAWNVKKRAAVKNFARGLWTKATPEFNNVVDSLANEYLETGTISKDSINQAFKELYRFAPESKAKRETVKREFTANVNILKSDLADVRRYLAARAETTEQARNKVEESLSVEEIWKAAKMQKREIYRVESRTLLTDYDKMVVGQLLRGEIYPHQIPKRADRKAVMEVYEARNQYETTMKWLRHHKKVHDAMVTSQVMDVIGDFPDWKDYKRGLPIKISTMERVFRKIAPSEEIAEKAIKELMTPVHEAVADANRLKNSIRRRVMALKLSRKAEKGKLSEAAAVQLLGEAEENIEQLKKQPAGEMRDGKTLEEWQAEITNLWESNPQLNEEKIRNAVKVFREIYDMLFRMANDARVRNGYEPVDYRKGYFPHFMNGKPDGLVAQLGKMLGVGNDVTALPTAINGLTKNFKPGKKFFGHELQRKTGETKLDAVEGLDRYLEGVADVIYLTDTIKRLRAFASAIRYLSTEDGIKEQIRRVKKMDIPKEERERRISEIRQKSPTTMSVFVAQLDEYINQLAGKQSEADRPMESALGRGWYNAMKWFESRVAVNQVGLNPGSWMTNILPLALAQASIRTDYIARGMWDTFVNRVRTAAYGDFDGFEDRSTFLVNRKGSDRMAKTPAQRVTARLTAGMEIIDYFIAESLTRARVYQNKAQGMSDYSAMEEADAWIPAMMGDRSKGALPIIFNEKNPLSKLMTMFQLEQITQFQHLFKDLPREKRKKTAWAMFMNCLLSTISAYILNDLLEFALGRRPGLDPLGMINEALGATTGFEAPNVLDAITGKDRDWKDEKKPFSEAGKEIFLDAMEQVPFVGGLIGGGRLPISAAVPDVNALWNAVSMATDDPETEETEGWTADRKRNTIIKELLDPVAYLLPPVGGGQAKKMLETGAAIYGHGSYNTSGNLQYPVFRDDWNTYVGGFIFGKSSLDTGVEWVDSGFRGLSESYSEAYKNLIDMGESDRDSWDVLKAMRDAEVPEGENYISRLAAERRRILRESSVSGEAKYMVYHDLLASDAERERMDALEGADPETVFNLFADMKELDDNSDKLAILRSALTEREKAILFDAVKEKENARLQAATKYVDSFLYADFLEAYAAAYTGEDGTVQGYSAERVEKILKAMSGVTNEEKAAIWQITANGEEGKSNPFSTKIGKEVWDTIQKLYDQIEEDGGIDWAGRH